MNHRSTHAKLMQFSSRKRPSIRMLSFLTDCMANHKNFGKFSTTKTPHGNSYISWISMRKQNDWASEKLDKWKLDYINPMNNALFFASCRLAENLHVTVKSHVLIWLMRQFGSQNREYISIMIFWAHLQG